MRRGNSISILLFLSLIYEVASLELLANYKYWKSNSDQLTYDYSGNSRHATIFMNYMVTDRGLSPNNDYWPSFMSYKNPKLADYTFSFWMYNNAGSGNIRLVLYPNSGSAFWFYYFFNINSINLDLRVSSLSKVTTIPMFVGWNLHTVRVFLDSTTLGRVNIHFYKNLVPIHSNFLYTGVNHTILNILHFGNKENSSALGLILHELWIHTGLSNISELSSLLSIYNCPTSSSSICSPTYPKSMNKLGQSCPTTCTVNSQSCDKNLSCIPKSKPECQYGLYDLETSECLFYCPNSSCSCPENSSTFSCSCNTGYKKVSDDPPACIPNPCITYDKVGYKYSCITLESGYTLNALGECCVCRTGFTQVFSNPVICVNTSVCIGYGISGGDYTWSSCGVGYMIDSAGKCNTCSSNYVSVLSNPFTCALKIEHCSDYIYDEFKLICQSCNEGYAVDENFMCNKCETDYVSVLSNPFTCISKIENCSSYLYDGSKWICQSCNQGYVVDENFMCNKCEDDYVKVLDDPLICISKIDNCKDYIYNGSEWICLACKEGYFHDMYGNCFECAPGYSEMLDTGCIPQYCINYIFIEDKYFCTECSLGYEIDTYGKCSLCEANYVKASEDPLICAVKIDNCSSYDIIYDVLKCNECSIGYLLGSSGLCDECEENYVRIESERVLCVPDIANCLDYEEKQEPLVCLKCKEGYILNHNNECKDCDNGYIRLPQDDSTCIKEIPHCLEYGENNSRYICVECSLEYEVDDQMHCNKCAKGYTHIKNSEFECVLEYNIGNQESDIDSAKEEVITKEQIQRVKMINSSNFIVTTTAIISASVASMTSMDPNTLILYINTIQLISYIQNLNIPLPYEIKMQQSSTNKYIRKINILSYHKIQDQTMVEYLQSSLNDEFSFLANTIYYLIMLLILITLNFIIFCISRYTKGKAKDIGNKILRYFKYTIYIQYYMIIYLDITYASLEKLYHVRFYSA